MSLSRPVAVYSSFLRNRARKPDTAPLVQHGIDRWTLELAAALAQCGQRVDLLVKTDRLPPGDRMPLPETVRLVKVGRTRVRSFWSLLRYVYRERPRAVIGGLRFANRQLLQLKRLCGAQVVLILTVHDHVSTRLAALGGRRRKAYLRELRGYACADAVVCVSEGVRSDLVAHVELPPARMLTVYNPVRVPPCDRQCGADDGLRIVLGVGRLGPDKGFDRLVDAFALLAADSSLRLVICGTGVESVAADLRRHIAARGLQDRVDLPGHVDEIGCWYRRAAVFVLSSRTEALPYVLLEALACGAPVVAFDCPTGPAEILDGGRFGRVVPNGDVAALAAAISAALDDPGNADERRERARQFDPAHIADTWLRLIDELSVAAQPQPVRDLLA